LNCPPLLEINKLVYVFESSRQGRGIALQAVPVPGSPRATQVQQGATRSPVRLTNQDSLPQDGRMTFFLKTEVPESFPRTEKIEVASTDSSFDALLSVADGNLVLQNSQMVMAKARSAEKFWGFGVWSAAVSAR
jgi:hypothetical protein